MSSALLQRLDARAAEIEAYVAFVTMVSGESAKLLLPSAKRRQRRDIDEQVVRILKANCFLLLYNAVEATITDGFKQIYQSISSDNCSISNLTQKVRELWLSGILDKLSAGSATHESYGKLARELVEAALADSSAQLDVGKLKFGGSLDARKIRRLCDAHGLPHNAHYRSRGGETLQLVKVNRNALAHGELSFVECGRDYSVEQLVQCSRETIVFLRSIVRNIDRYNSGRAYRKP